jgi:hypothetical protein
MRDSRSAFGGAAHRGRAILSRQKKDAAQALTTHFSGIGLRLQKLSGAGFASERDGGVASEREGAEIGPPIGDYASARG